jgi:hypothetical protein
MTWVADFVHWLQQLPPALKVIASVIVMTLATMMVAVLWQAPAGAQPKVPRASSHWPEDASLQELVKLLGRTSAINKQLLLAVHNAGPNGIYIEPLAQQLKLSRDEVRYRAKELSDLHLLETLALTDINYRIHDDVHTAVGPNGGHFLTALLQ